MPFTEEHRAALQRAVDCLNETMAEIIRECGDSVVVRPWANFSRDDGIAAVEIEVTTGRLRIG